MNQAKINIGQLNIRLRGLSSQTAQGMTSGLGSEILSHLAEQSLLSGRLDQVDAGQLAVTSATASELRRVVARQIALAVAARTGNMGLGS
jgi:hypothetical protein